MRHDFRVLTIAFALLFSFFVFSCGGASSSSSPQDPPEENGADNDDQSDDEIDTNDDEQPSVTPGLQGSLSLGNLVVNRADTPTRFNLNNQNQTLEPIEQDGVFLVYETASDGNVDYYALGFDGEYVDGASAAWFDRETFQGDSEFYVVGDLVRPDAVPGMIAIYRGEFMVSRSWQDDLRTLSTPMEYRLDFNNASLEGYDIPNQAVVRMDGEIDGNQISGTINYPFGTDQFSGGIFGPSGEEIAGGFENGGTSAIFYGSYDSDLSRAVSN